MQRNDYKPLAPSSCFKAPKSVFADRDRTVHRRRASSAYFIASLRGLDLVIPCENREAGAEAPNRWLGSNAMAPKNHLLPSVTHVTDVTMKRVNLTFTDAEHVTLVTAAGREPLAAFVKRKLFEAISEDTWHKGPSAEMPTSPKPTKTCKHGKPKGHNCWQCGGLAVIEI